MVSYITLYHGETADGAKPIATSTDPAVVSRFASELLHDPNYTEDSVSDPILSAILSGKRLALRMISGLRWPEGVRSGDREA